MISEIVKKAWYPVRANSPIVLTALGISGTVTTAYLAAKAGHQHARKMSEESPFQSKLEEAKIVWRFYIPPALSASATIACVVAASRVSSKRTAAAYSLLAVSEKAFVEYRDKVIEQIGEKKEQGIRDQIAQDRVDKNPPVVVIGSGPVLCCELHTGRYFNSNMETLKRAQNEINAQLLSQNYANLNDFYYLIGLPVTSYSGDTGWTSDKLMEMRFSTVLHDEKPCLAFEYNYVKGI